MDKTPELTVPPGSIEQPAYDLAEQWSDPVDSHDIGAAAQLSIAISLKRIADAMEKDAMDCSRSMEIKDGVKTVWRTEKGATHSYSEPFPPPPGDSTAEGTPVRPVDMAKQPQCTLWQRIKRAILHPTNFIQDDGSHSW